MSKPVLGVKKQGNAVTVFVNPTTDRPIPITQFDEEPVGGFPKIYGAEEVRFAFPSYDVRFVEGEVPTPPESDVYLVPDEEVDKVDRAGKEHMKLVAAKHAGKKGGVAQPPTVTQHSLDRPAPLHHGPVPSPAEVPTVAVLVKVEQEIRTMLAKRQVATGAARKKLDQEINHVFNFLVRVEPGVRDSLRALADSYREQESEQF